MLSVVNEANLQPSKSMAEGIFRDNITVAINVRVKTAAIDATGEGYDVSRCGGAVPATALSFAESGPPPACR